MLTWRLLGLVHWANPDEKKPANRGHFLVLVRKVGLEPTRPFERWNLNPVRLPISPLPRSSSSLTNFCCG
jgi:hypothetical protein